MASIGNFKNYERTSRVVDVEENYGMGMNFNEATLNEGFCRMLVNFKQYNRGETLRPRGGLNYLEHVKLNANSMDNYVHHTGSMFVEDIDNDDAYIMKYMFIGVADVNNYGVDVDTSTMIVEDKDTGAYIKVPLSTDNTAGLVVKHSTNSNFTELHGEEIEAPAPNGIFTSIENNNYVIAKDGSTEFLARIRVMFTSGNYEYKIEPIIPKSITPHQAVNYGYNLLRDNPYSFTNEVSGTGQLQLLGVLPYDSADNLKFNAQVGEEITFKLNYKYPSGAPNYKVQWEVQDVTALSGVQVLQDVSDSPTITSGDPIEHTFIAPYKQFSVIVKVYLATDTTNPERAIVLPNYYLSDDNENTNKNIEVKNYNIQTATGLTTFENRAVAWGVQGATNTLFFSDINDPSYFPYPHGAEPIGENIIKAVPFLDNLLVFTETRIIRISPSRENGWFNTEVIQENLNLNYRDRDTITVVKSMVYFKIIVIKAQMHYN